MYYIDDEFGTYGSYNIDTNYFEIVDITGGVHVLATLDILHDFGVCGTLDAPSFVTGVNDDNVVLRSHPPCDSRVLFLVANSVRDVVASIEQKSRRDLHEMNTGLKNSIILPQSARMKWAGIDDFDYTQDVNQPGGTAIDLLINNLDLQETLSDFQEQYNSDIIVVYVPTAFALTVVGVATINAQNLGESIVLVTASGNVRKLIVAHELGHILAARHSNDEDATFNRAFELRVSFIRTAKTTVFETAKGFHVNAYSTPLVGYKGEPIGDDTHDNARRMKVEGCRIASLDSLTTLSGNIGSPSEITLGFPFNLTAQVVGGASPYSYEWLITENGVDFTSIGTSSTIQHTVYSAQGSFVFVKLKITDGSGTTTFSYRRLLVINNLLIIPGNEQGDWGEILEIFPNPANARANVTFTLSQEGQVQFDLVGIDGISAKVHEGHYGIGEHQISFTLSPELSPFKNKVNWLVLSMQGRVVDSKPLKITD